MLSFLLKSNLRSGPGEFKNLPEYISQLGFSKAAIVIDTALKNIANISRVVDICRHQLEKCEVIIYDLRGEPSYDYLDLCVSKLREHADIQVIIGIGGGSTLDLAKGMALLMVNPGDGLTYRGFPTQIRDPLPVIAIPSTAGTGSEATYNAVFTDTSTQKKLGINSLKNFPILSILDPNLILSCPAEVMASSGLDAVVHAVEGFVSKKANILSRMFSARAYGLLSRNLKLIKKEPQNLEVLNNLQLGAYLAIIGLANSSAGPAGALSYVLGPWYKVPHGVAGAFFLPEIQKFNFKHGYLDYALLYESESDSNSVTRADKAGFIINELFELNDLFALPKKINAFNVEKDDFEKFVQASLFDLKGMFAMNPVSMTEEDIRGILSNYF